MASTTRLRLIAEHGRRVGRLSKDARCAAQPALDVARMSRALAQIRAEAEKAQAEAERAELILAAAFKAACSDDLIVARALAREAMVECAVSHRFRLLVRFCEMAEEGDLCA